MGKTFSQLKDNINNAQEKDKGEINRFFQFCEAKEKLLLSEFKQQGTVTKADYEIGIDKVISFRSHSLFTKQDGPDTTLNGEIAQGIDDIVKAQWKEGIQNTIINLMKVVFGSSFGSECKEWATYFHIGDYGSVTRIDIMAYRKETDITKFGFENCEHMLVVCWRLASVKMNTVDHSTFFSILDMNGYKEEKCKSIVENWEKYRTKDAEEPPAKRRKLNGGGAAAVEPE